MTSGNGCKSISSSRRPAQSRPKKTARTVHKHQVYIEALVFLAHVVPCLRTKASTRYYTIPYHIIPYQRIIYYFVPNGRFSRNSSLFSFGRRSFLVLPAARAQRGPVWIVPCKCWLRPGSVAHALDGQSHRTQQATKGVGSHFRKATPGLGNLPGSSCFELQILSSFIFLL